MRQDERDAQRNAERDRTPGAVDRRDAKREAERSAEAIEGVDNVINQLPATRGANADDPEDRRKE